MRELLFLSHRIPYPPDKGDKIRSYHLFRALAGRYRVHLGTFVDDPTDWEHEAALRRLCGEVCLRPLNPSLRRLASTAGLLRGEALSVAYYRDGALLRWVADLASRRSLAGVFVFSSSMGQYGMNVALAPGGRRVIDFCDVDSDKWRQYARSHRLPMSLVYSREASRLAEAERRFLASFDATLVVSQAEAELLGDLDDALLRRVHVVPNGVDTAYFDPSLPYDSPFNCNQPSLVFTGAMDYHANVDGVVWFARHILPKVRSMVPSARFVIIGSNPVPEVRALATLPGVVVTGRVPDVRPYLAHAAMVVAPLRIARGVQNKVLEALAMARPVVATHNAVQGLPGAADSGIAIESDAKRMAEIIARRLQDSVADDSGRRFVLERFGWQGSLDRVADIVAGRL